MVIDKEICHHRESSGLKIIFEIKSLCSGAPMINLMVEERANKFSVVVNLEVITFLLLGRVLK